MVTDVPPPKGPAVGLMPVTTGTAAHVVAETGGDENAEFPVLV